jgi:CRISPR-associated protein Csb3
MIELAAFVGLQRFRPRPNSGADSFSYTAWTQSLPPMLAAVACCGQMPQTHAREFEFLLLYRTKYLKSFLPAKPKGD